MESTRGAGEGAGKAVDAGASEEPLRQLFRGWGRRWPRRWPWSGERGKGVEVGREHPIDKPAELHALELGDGARTGDGGRRQGEVHRAAESAAGLVEGGALEHVNGLFHAHTIAHDGIHAHTIAHTVDEGGRRADGVRLGGRGGVCARVVTPPFCTGNGRPLYEKRCTLANSG